MSSRKKMKLDLPNGMKLPERVELPEVTVEVAYIKKTILDEAGNLTEIEETIEVPIISEET